ncbi:unnamed protein product [Linum tenue]|uniref:DUF1664 domain-containing protein n=1 Tax=Linum tenue TaxID=586396 RepID=A0AAV0S5G1_9ROSI|nr:unnamed protein product [Linum tenue]
MAMQAALGSRVLLIAGAGYLGTVLIQKGKLSELIGEIQALVKGIEKGDSDGETDVLTHQVGLLAQQVRQLGSFRHITVLNNGQSGNYTGLIIPAATVGAVGYGYIWWKGWKISDLMYVTKQSMTAAVSNLTKHLEGVTDALAKAKEHLTQRIQGLDDKMDVQNEISRKIESDVNTIHDNIQMLDSEVGQLISFVSGLSLANYGIDCLCNLVKGKEVIMPKEMEVKFVSGSSRAITFPGDSGSMVMIYYITVSPKAAGIYFDTFHEGLKALDYLSILSDDIQVNGEEPQSPPRRLVLPRANSVKA